LAEWSIALVLKTSILKGIVGSNPTSSAIASVAQLVEQLIFNQQVIGSNPVRSSAVI
jgi:hypothetical protein